MMFMSDETNEQPVEKLPYINEQGDLVIPFDSPERYHYWKNGGMPLEKTLAELNASPEIVAKYTKNPSDR